MLAPPSLRAGPALLVATRKGVFYLQPLGDPDGAWQLSEPSFLGHIAHHVVLDPRDGRTLVAALKTGHLGPTVFHSRDAGRNWTEARRPPAFPKARDGEPVRAVEHTFWLTAGHAQRPGHWYAGTSPQALWRSEDGGATWEGVRGFNEHEDYALRTEDPQGGTPDGPVLHSVLIDPRDPRHMYLGLSGGGVYESCDEGTTWEAMNESMSTAFAEPDSELWRAVGPDHDPHSVQLHPLQPDLLYQQNHCGIYTLRRPATRWQRVGRNMPADVGDIGFVIGLHPRDVNTCWVFPMDGSDVWPRTSPGGRPAVYVTHDAGASWQCQSNGLPQHGWFTVKRQGMAIAGDAVAQVYFGTTSGEVWASADGGEHWRRIAAHLPEIYALEAAVIA